MRLVTVIEFIQETLFQLLNAATKKTYEQPIGYTALELSHDTNWHYSR